MRSQNIRCIILGHRNFGEQDKIISLYSDNFGKIKAIAKGSRKITSKFTGHLETLNSCNISLYFGPKNILITEAQTTRSHNALRANLSKLKSGMQLAEVTNQLLYDNQSIDNLLSTIEETLSYLIKHNKDSIITYSYILKLLDKTGHVPNFKNTDTNLKPKFLKFFHFIQTQPLSEIQRITLTEEEDREIKEKLKYILEEQIQRPLRSFAI